MIKCLSSEVKLPPFSSVKVLIQARLETSIQIFSIAVSFLKASAWGGGGYLRSLGIYEVFFYPDAVIMQLELHMCKHDEIVTYLQVKVCDYRKTDGFLSILIALRGGLLHAMLCTHVLYRYTGYL